MELRSIEIDFDIYKMIEAERRSFDEPQYVALRRLLALPQPQLEESDDAVARDGNPFVEDGVSIPHGSDARMRYLRGTQLYEGKFLDGMLVVNGRKYPTLSAAASDLARTKDGKKTSLNGWLYWEARAPGAVQWRSLNDMRAQVNRQLKNIENFI